MQREGKVQAIDTQFQWPKESELENLTDESKLRGESRRWRWRTIDQREESEEEEAKEEQETNEKERNINDEEEGSNVVIAIFDSAICKKIFFGADVCLWAFVWFFYFIPIPIVVVVVVAVAILCLYKFIFIFLLSNFFHLNFSIGCGMCIHTFTHTPYNDTTEIKRGRKKTNKRNESCSSSLICSKQWLTMCLFGVCGLSRFSLSHPLSIYY